MQTWTLQIPPSRSWTTLNRSPLPSCFMNDDDVTFWKQHTLQNAHRQSTSWTGLKCDSKLCFICPSLLHWRLSVPLPTCLPGQGMYDAKNQSFFLPLLMKGHSQTGIFSQCKVQIWTTVINSNYVKRTPAGRARQHFIQIHYWLSQKPLGGWGSYPHTPILNLDWVGWPKYKNKKQLD